MKNRIEVVAAAVVQNGTVLSALRSATMSLPGMWEFPGGKIEPGETPEVALAREMQEELRCTVEVGDLVESTAHEYDFALITLTTFYATIVAGTPQLTEHAAMKWLPIKDLDSVPWAPADVPAVRKIIAELG